MLKGGEEGEGDEETSKTRKETRNGTWVFRRQKIIDKFLSPHIEQTRQPFNHENFA